VSARERSDVLHLAARKQRGRMLAPAVLESLSAAVQQTLSAGNLLSLEQTETLFAAYTDAFDTCVRGERPHVYLRSSRDDARALLSRLVHGGRWLDDDVVMFNRHSSYTGAVKMPAAPFFAAAETLLLLEADDLRAASPDGSQGLLIDILDRENALDLWCWGEEWLALVRDGGGEGGAREPAFS
jgi:hypothetical protein